MANSRNRWFILPIGDAANESISRFLQIGPGEYPELYQGPALALSGTEEEIHAYECSWREIQQALHSSNGLRFRLFNQNANGRVREVPKRILQGKKASKEQKAAAVA